MWKCIHRGLRTSANLLKTDKSNGGCIVSSTICKDIDEFQYQPRKLTSYTSADGNIPSNERKRVIDGNLVSREPCISAEQQIGENSCNSFIATKFQSESSAYNSDHHVQNCEKASSADIPSCTGCHEFHCCCSETNSAESLDFSKIRPRSWLAKKLHLHYPCSCVQTASATRHVFLDPSAVRRPTYFDIPVESSLQNNSVTSEESDSPFKIHDPSTVSFLQPYHSQKNLQPNHERNRTLRERSQVCHNFTSCLLKLPFLSYDFMRSKGLNQLYECMLNKSKNEYKGIGCDGQKREKDEKKEGAEKESWRHHQRQQSLLEAIGFSSALLLGWFLVQFRIYNPCRERHSTEHKQRENEGRCVFSRLIFSKVKNDHQPLNAIPSNNHKSKNTPATEKQIPPTEEKINSADSGNDCTAQTFSASYNSDDLEEGRFSSDLVSSLTYREVIDDVQGKWRQKVHSVAAEKEPIPMPWYSQESKDFGPITLEQAVDEAGRGLEEAHAEVLLQLALEKLEDGDDSNDDMSAVDLLTKAAHLGSPVAAFNLGICFEMGVGGVTKDLSKAYYWYKVASEGGHAGAIYNMAIYHAQGLAGLSVDTKLAHQLLEKASSFELPEARDALTLLTSLKQTETEGLSDDLSAIALEIDKSSSQLSSTERKSDTSVIVENDQPDTSETGTSHSTKSNNVFSFGHMMAESLLSSFVSEDDACSELALVNTQCAKQGNLNYVSALALAH